MTLLHTPGSWGQGERLSTELLAESRDKVHQIGRAGEGACRRKERGGKENPLPESRQHGRLPEAGHSGGIWRSERLALGVDLEDSMEAEKAPEGDGRMRRCQRRIMWSFV